MRWPQFSLRTLSVLVACAAVSSAALVYASETWSTTLFTGVVVWLTFAVLAAAYRQAVVRAFWMGTAICGWVYLVLLFWPASDRQQFGPWYTMEIGSELATTRLAHWAYEHVLPKIRKPPAPQGGSQGSFGTGGGGGFFYPQFGGGRGTSGVADMKQIVAQSRSVERSYPDEATFVRVAHAVSAWLMAMLGGAVGRWLYLTQNCGTRPKSEV